MEIKEHDFLINILNQSLIIDELDIRDIKFIDWGEILKQACMHKIIPIVYRELKRHGLLKYVNGQVKKLMSMIDGCSTEIDYFFRKESVKISERLRECNINNCILKGPIVSIFSYPEIGMRQYGDIDILISKEKLNLTKNLLVEMGYTQGIYNAEKNIIEKFNRASIMRRELFTHETAEFTKMQDIRFLPASIVDVNHSLSWRGHKDNDSFQMFNVNEVLINTANYIWDDLTIIGPIPEILFLHLCVHLYNESVFLCWHSNWWRDFVDIQLAKFYDIALLLKRELCWKKVCDLSEKFTLKIPLTYTLSFTKQLFPQINIPYELKEGFTDCSMHDIYYTRQGDKKYWETDFIRRVFRQDLRLKEVKMNSISGEVVDF